MPECHLSFTIQPYFKGVNIPEINSFLKIIQGGQHPGMGGQHKTEWGVNMVRNLQSDLFELPFVPNLDII